VTGETSDTQVARFGINDFLSDAREPPAQPALLVALDAIFHSTEGRPTAVTGDNSEGAFAS
jgi:hypothetical protein